MASELGARIKEAAKKIGGNRALAARLGVNERTIGDYIRGREPKLSVLSEIASLTDVSYVWLVIGTHPDADHVDMNLLSHCIAETERQEEERGINIDPDNKALVISTLYKTLLANRPAVAEDSDTPSEQGAPISGAKHG